MLYSRSKKSVLICVIRGELKVAKQLRILQHSSYLRDRKFFILTISVIRAGNSCNHLSKEPRYTHIGILVQLYYRF